MRIPKFRQWNSSAKSFHYWGYVDGDDTFISPIHGDSQQFTGLLDKRGKEIYEGDILRITCSCGHQENLAVEWKDGVNGYFAGANEQHDWDSEQLKLIWTERDTEIIGNIYTNSYRHG